MESNSIKSHVQGFSAVDVFVHHQIAQLSHSQPIIGTIDQSQALSAVQIFKNSANNLFHGFEPSGQEFVTQQILQATKSGHKSVDTF
ncbi:MAG: hypothetical protein RJB14_3751 [Pseudomonadota bacterium]|jgi:hypothetical protein